LASIFALRLGTALAQTDGGASNDVAPETKPAADALSVLVVPLEAERVDPGLARTVDDLISADLRTRANLRVTTLAEVNQLVLAEMRRDAVGCDDVSCSAEIAGAVGSDRILSGRIGRLGSSLVLTLRWLDAVYSKPLAQATEDAGGDEGRLPNAVKRAIARVLDEALPADQQARQYKRHPTFWTFEVAGGASFPSYNEEYTLPVAASAQLAWGGRPRGYNLYFTVLGGGGIAYASGEQSDAGGKVSYSRVHGDLHAALRLAVPIANRNRTRLFFLVGPEVLFESYTASRQGGANSEGSAQLFAVRAGAGLWHRFNYENSLFGGYRLRTIFNGSGAEPLSEAVALGSSAKTTWVHTVEVGWAYQF